MITIATSALKNALSIVGNAVERSETLPILGHLLCALDAEAQTLAITGTDIEQTITTKIEIQCDQSESNPERFTLSYSKLKSIIATTRAPVINLSVGDTRAKLKADSARFQLAILPPKDFPEPPAAERQPMTLDGGHLRSAITATTAAAGIPGKEPRFYLHGIYIEHAEDTLTLVATDGHRLHVATIPGITGQSANFILPRKTALTLARLIPDEEITLHIGETDLVVDIAETLVHTKLIDGRYPDWRRVIPTETRATATCSAIALRQGINGCSVTSNEDYHAIKLNLVTEPEKPGIRISATNTLQEQSDDHVAGAIDGDPLEAGYNAGYLTQALDALNGAEAQISFSDSAALLRQREHEGRVEVFALVMNMRI